MKKLKQAAALSYIPDKDSAPRVVAAGRGYLAEKIISLAEQNDIPLFEDEWTADILCSMPINSEIPDTMYQTVAEIYAFILNMDKKQTAYKD